MQGQLFVLSGPSGVGKSTILKAVRERLDGLAYSISHTSRKPRPKEVHGKDYHFADRKTFESMIQEGKFAEWATVYGDYYGTSLPELKKPLSLGLDVLLDLDSQGAQNIKNHFEKSLLVYILPPSLKALKQRLESRAADGKDIVKRRMERASEEIRECVFYDYIIINDDLERAIEEFKSIILAERCRTARRAPQLKDLFDLPFP